MSARIIDGKAIAETLRNEIRERVAALAERGIVPGLGVVLVGEDPASISYVTSKERACADLGIHSDDNRLPAETTQEELLAVVRRLNADPSIHGILVQLPLPKHLDERSVIAAISPEKDADGFHPESLGHLLRNEPGFLPCTPYGIVKMLELSNIPIAGAHVVIVGRSVTVGKSLANILLRKGSGGDATVTVCHSATKSLETHTRQADILIAAIGRAEMITGAMIKPGATVIDVGMNRVPDASRKRGYRLTGDVDFASAATVAGAITPVPGGVGPLTITMLLSNTVEAAAR